MRHTWLTTILVCSTLLSPSSWARVIRVGVGGEVSRIADAAQLAKDGDIVEIAGGEWHGDVALWSQRQLTIRGIGRRPVLVADGKSAEGKAIWVIRNGDFLIENIEFRGARVADGNGAGIRFEGGRLLIRNCAFLDNQMGVLTSNDEKAELVIESSLFAEAVKQEQPLSHLLYAGRIASLKISGSRFHSGYIGHLIKSRARGTDIRYNLIYDGAAGRASYEVDLPNGGEAMLIGNVIGQSSTTANPVMIAYGAEGESWPRNRLVLSHNTLISEGMKPAWFIRAWRQRLPAGTQVHTLNNLFSGVGLFNYGLSGIQVGNYPLWHGAFAGVEVLDFRPNGASWLRGVVGKPSIEGQDVSPGAEFALPLGLRNLPDVELLMPGAMQ